MPCLCGYTVCLFGLLGFLYLALHSSIVLYDDVSLSNASWDSLPSVVDSASGITMSPPNPYHPIACTTDTWSGPDRAGYICLTAHWLDDDFFMKQALLDIRLCTDHHTGENLRDWIWDLLRRTGINVTIISSSGSECPLSFILCLCFFCFQLLDVAGISHDHGPDVSKAVRISLTHSFVVF